MQSNLRQACSPAQNHGVRGELCPEFPGFPAVGPTGPARVPLETCAAEAACLPPPRPGGAGTARLMSTRRGAPLTAFEALSTFPVFSQKLAF